MYMKTFIHINKQNTSEKGRIVRIVLKLLILLHNMAYYLLTFITILYNIILYLHNTRAQDTQNKTLKSFDIPIYRNGVMHNGEKINRRELDGYVQSSPQSMDVHR